MIKATVLYGHPADPAAFDAYYTSSHIPMVERAGLPHTEASRVVGTPTGETPPYYRMFEMWFDSMEQMQQALGSPGARAMADDLVNFATGGVTILISAVEE